MKQINIPALALLLVASWTLFTCKPQPKGELGETFDKVKGMTGTWEINTFSQLDLNNPVQEERDLSEFYVVAGETPLTITFNSDFTYAVVPGSGKNYFGTSGAWRFDNNEAPTNLYLENATDTLQFDLGAVVREFDSELNIELPRYCEDAEGNRQNTVIYKFKFNRQ
ncbi:MAG: DUF5004 domain-containing protein [Flavobacteriales bacterium]